MVLSSLCQMVDGPNQAVGHDSLHQMVGRGAQGADRHALSRMEGEEDD